MQGRILSKRLCELCNKCRLTECRLSVTCCGQRGKKVMCCLKCLLLCVLVACRKIYNYRPIFAFQFQYRIVHFNKLILCAAVCLVGSGRVGSRNFNSYQSLLPTFTIVYTLYGDRLRFGSCQHAFCMATKCLVTVFRV